MTLSLTLTLLAAPAVACCLQDVGLGAAGPAYLRELSLLQRNTAAGQAGPVASALVRHLPGMSEEGLAAADVPRTSSGGSSGAGGRQA